MKLNEDARQRIAQLTSVAENKLRIAVRDASESHKPDHYLGYFVEYAKSVYDANAGEHLTVVADRNEFMVCCERILDRIIAALLPSSLLDDHLAEYRKRLAEIGPNKETTLDEAGNTFLVNRRLIANDEAGSADRFWGRDLDLEPVPEFDRIADPHSLVEEVLLPVAPVAAFGIRTEESKKAISESIRNALSARETFWQSKAIAYFGNAVSEGRTEVENQCLELSQPLIQAPSVSDKQIYAQAGVSKQTFYKYKRGKQVSDKTRRKIQSAENALRPA